MPVTQLLSQAFYCYLTTCLYLTRLHHLLGAGLRACIQRLVLVSVHLKVCTAAHNCYSLDTGIVEPTQDAVSQAGLWLVSTPPFLDPLGNADKNEQLPNSTSK